MPDDLALLHAATRRAVAELLNPADIVVVVAGESEEANDASCYFPSQWPRQDIASLEDAQLETQPTTLVGLAVPRSKGARSLLNEVLSSAKGAIALTYSRDKPLHGAFSDVAPVLLLVETVAGDGMAIFDPRAKDGTHCWLAEASADRGSQDEVSIVKSYLETIDSKRPLAIRAQMAAVISAQAQDAVHLRDLVEVVEPVDLRADMAAEGLRVIRPDVLRVADLQDGNLQTVALTKLSRGAIVRANDVIVEAFRPHTGGPLLVRHIRPSDGRLVADQNVLVLRPRADLADSADAVSFLASFLATEQAASMMPASKGRRLRKTDILELRMPVVNEARLAALHDLAGTRDALASWDAELRAAMDVVLTTCDAATTADLRSIGIRLRQRVAAGRNLDKLGHRIRTLYPHPIALSWRRVESAEEGLHRFRETLRCAESVAAFLAYMGILLADSVKVELNSQVQLSERLASKAGGLTFGDYITILDEVAGGRVKQHLGTDAPFVELPETLRNESPARVALQNISMYRNDDAHQRGPEGAQLYSQLSEVGRSLEVVLEECEWLSEYPLRLIDGTSWDDITESGWYEYRELMGDHHLVPARREATSTPTLNRDRIYVCDRDGGLHRLFPLVVWAVCPECQTPAAFGPDRFGPDGGVKLKALDHRHSLRADELRPAFEHLGLVAPA